MVITYGIWLFVPQSSQQYLQTYLAPGRETHYLNGSVICVTRSGDREIQGWLIVLSSSLVCTRVHCRHANHPEYSK